MHGGPGGRVAAVYERVFLIRRGIALFCLISGGCGRVDAVRFFAGEYDLAFVVADMERLREHLGISRWLVCGGSWGSALGLGLCVDASGRRWGFLLLRGIFYFAAEGAAVVFIRRGRVGCFRICGRGFVAPIPPVERGDLMGAYYRRLTRG